MTFFAEVWEFVWTPVSVPLAIPPKIIKIHLVKLDRTERVGIKAHLSNYIELQLYRNEYI